MLALVLLHSAIFRADLDALVRTGEPRYCVAVATRREQAAIVLNAARSIVQRSPLLAGLLVGETEDSLRFELEGGARTVLSAFPCTSRAIRGWPISTLALDEYAHHVTSDGDSAAESVWAATTPAVAQFGAGARIIASSTPAGEANFFASLHQRAVSGENPNSYAFQYASWEVNPTLSESELREQEPDPDLFASEFEARFVGGAGSLLDFDRITIADYVEFAPLAGEHWLVAIDPGFQQDPFAAVVLGRAIQDRRRLLVGAVRAWDARKPATPDERSQVEEELYGNVVDLAERYGAKRVLSDANYQSRIGESRLRAAGLSPVTRSLVGRDRFRAFSTLRSALYTGELELPDDPDLIRELRTLRVKHAGQRSDVVVPRSARGHADRAMALVLAVDELARHSPLDGKRRPRRQHLDPFVDGDAVPLVNPLDVRPGRPFTAGLMNRRL